MSEDRTQGNEQPQEQPAEEQPRRQEHMIPKHRFDDVSRRAKEAEKRLQTLEGEQQQREEERASQQGEYQQLADKRQKKVEQLQARVQELEGQMVRDRRYRSFVSAASGTILPEAFDDAFSMLTDDEWGGVNDEDENGVRMLAQNLAERKPYLAASPRGSGSGGSRQPVFGLQSGNGGGQNGSGVRPLQFAKPQKHWK